MDKNMPMLVLPGEEEIEKKEADVQQAQAAAVQAAPQEAESEEAKAEEKPMEPVDAKDDSLNIDNLSQQEQEAVLAFV
jgi:hypothetical protein